MTLPVFPQLPGLGWPLTRSPMWQTGVQKTQSGRELRASYMSYPRYKWSATFEVLRAAAIYNLAEFQQLLAFFNASAGQFGQFVFNDPDDNTATTQEFAIADGVTTQYQVLKSFGGYVEPAGFVNGGAQIFVGGTLLSSGYTLNSPYNGWITFATAPAASSALTWTGTYGYVCRFFDDTYDFDRFMTGLYSMKKLEFISCKP
jgi:uncharacterized protein (TIGR02217 family)